ncbi:MULTISPECIES: DUF3822 family protein [Aequorivita]|uniref:DUF3822 family protein n=1 Tax=Aequorivita iocasae TaxID=2803865 RepID=A0ABX7DRB5_9FLAO|nr:MULTISPECIES: DUF3822 family protein [Aequorivita]QQX76297.1 DUF3822 family protein [Aequorivita iocasae]UCA55760.1 DUF3822 family protein [Aequorivita sp. F7]
MQQKTTKIQNTINNRLSVQVSLNGLSFLVTNPENEEAIFFLEKKLDYSTTPEELLMEIESIMFTNNILNSTFSEVSLVYSTPVYSLVPATLFDETKASEYLKFNSRILANDYMAHDILENLEIVVVYVPFMNINNFFFEKYGSFSYYHSVTVMLKTILEKEKYSLPKMYLHFQKNSFDCIVFKNSGLQLCNSYTYKTPEDFIYYTLFCMEQLSLSPENLPVVLLGEIEKEDENFKIAYSYIRNLEFLDSDFSNKINLNPAKSHQHFILKNVL